MKKLKLFTILPLLAIAFIAFTSTADKLVTSKTHIKFFSTTPVEDIQANNYKSTGSIDTKTGQIVFSVPMQSFEFEKALMQKHFNSGKFLDTKAHPRAQLSGTISNLSEIDFGKDGTYKAKVSGDLSIKGKTNKINETATITVSGGAVKLESKFNVTLSDYDVVFTSGKPSKNIAKTVEVTVVADYK